MPPKARKLSAPVKVWLVINGALTCYLTYCGFFLWDEPQASGVLFFNASLVTLLLYVVARIAGG